MISIMDKNQTRQLGGLRKWILRYEDWQLEYQME